MNVYERIKALVPYYKNTSDRGMTYESCAEVSKTDRPPYISLCALIDVLPKRDFYKINFIDSTEKELVFTNQQKPSSDNYDKFWSYIEADEQISLKIIINKQIEDDTLSIYDLSSFSAWVCDKGIQDVLKYFDSILSKRETIIFNVLDRNILFSTKTMVFSNNSKIQKHYDSRLEKIEKSMDTTYFLNINDCHLIPDDFEIDECDTNQPVFALSGLFSKLKTILSIVYLSSTATLYDDHMKIQISAQRALESEITYDSITQNNTLYKIYDWIYSEGNPTDKALIARNIISLHCKYSSILEADYKTYSSIQSNYQLYLKDNVKDYLALKNKLAALICQLSVDVSDRLLSLLSDFKKNIIAVFGFFISVVLVNITSSTPLDNILTHDIVIVFNIILLGSAVFWIISLLEAEIASYNIVKTYNRLKQNYHGLLSDEELDEVFQNDEIINNAKKRIHNGMVIYSIIWIAFIVITFLVVRHYMHP